MRRRGLHRASRAGSRLRSAIVAVAVAVATVLAMAGCGDDGGSGAQGGGGNGASELEGKRIAFGFPFRAVDIYKPLIAAAKAEADKRGVELLESSAGISAAEQLAEVNTWIASDVDAIVLFALDPQSMAPVVKRAQDAGIKVIGYAENVPGEDGSIVFNNEQGADLIGTATGEYINEELGGKANVGVLSFTAGEQNRIRTGNAVDKITELAPGAKVVARAQANDAGTALKVGKPMLNANPDINVVVANTDDDINGFVAALKSVGRDSDSVWFASYDASTPVLKKLRTGEVKGITAGLPIPAVGRAVVEAPVNAITGRGSTSLNPDYVGVTHETPDLIDQMLSERGAK